MLCINSEHTLVDLCGITDFSAVGQLIFSLCFILIRVTLNTESIPGTLGVSWEHNPDGTLVHHRAPCIHTHSHL